MNNKKYTMIGGDLSHHNYGAVDPTYWDFVFLKASEGRTYVDHCMERYLEDLAQGGVIPFIGFYHYARPENNAPLTEVEHFLKTIKPHIGNCMVALDIENEALRVDHLDDWVMTWCNEVANRTKSKPLIYISSSQAHKVIGSLKKYPLWVAHYNVQKPQSKRMQINPVMWQCTKKPFDIDIFYGTSGDIASLIRGYDNDDIL